MATRTLTTFQLNAEETALLRRPLVGQGGFQSFGRMLQKLLGEDGTIVLSDEQVGRIFRLAAYCDGDGGFEARMRGAFGRSLAAPFVSEQRSLLPELVGV